MDNVTAMPLAEHNPVNAIIAANVRAEIGYADTSQAAVAAQLGISEMALSRRLNDRSATEFTGSEIDALAKLFGIDPGDLFKERVRPTGPQPVAPTV